MSHPELGIMRLLDAWDHPLVDPSFAEFTSPYGAKLYENIRARYDIGHVLGSGSFGQVRTCTLRENGERRAVKLLEQSCDGSVAMFDREVTLLMRVRSEHIIRCHDFFKDRHFLYIVMELCTGGELLQKVIEMRRFCEEDAACVCRQVVSAIESIHSAGICHRDIKAENLLLDGEGDVKTCRVKMIDFGLATDVSCAGRLEELCGSPHYLAPELLGQNYSFPVDLWSLGVLMYLLLSAHRRVTASRMKVSPVVEERRNSVLRIMDEDYKKGLSEGQRVDTAAMQEVTSKPEFVRRDNKLMTAPSWAWRSKKLPWRPTDQKIQEDQEMLDVLPCEAPEEADRRIGRRGSETNLAEADKAKLRVICLDVFEIRRLNHVECHAGKKNGGLTPFGLCHSIVTSAGLFLKSISMLVTHRQTQPHVLLDANPRAEKLHFRNNSTVREDSEGSTTTSAGSWPGRIEGFGLPPRSSFDQLQCDGLDTVYAPPMQSARVRPHQQLNSPKPPGPALLRCRLKIFARHFKPLTSA
ncbi:Serine/threonine-protein kinase 17A [Perkinsus olseni]|uniref:Serine/threonine-protein kinase 17A n=1 Tax=Perkinsus olseni TaxID=32597 RepID=A0A7J6Q256_PEROL|nr:Serine/threonine-protein kinase 17A [Perkinsus olseni]